MIHVLSWHRRSEFLSGSCIARFEMCLTDDDSKPTLYIKSNIIDLYFVSKCGSFSIDVIEDDNGGLVYILGIDEGEDFPFHLFSAVEIHSEKAALAAVLSGEEFDVILFNDYAIEIARATGRYEGQADKLGMLQAIVPSGPDYSGESYERIAALVSGYIESDRPGLSPNVSLSKFTSDARSSVISGSGSVMHIAGFSGATEVHEMLPQIVGDHTLLRFVHSPERETSQNANKEFADALIMGQAGYLSIQAKCFDFDGELPPTSRSNAEKRMRKNVRKAINQTKGSSRMICEGRRILANGVPIEISSDALFIFCIFVPSLDLIFGEMDAELSALGSQLRERGQLLVVLDPMQFLRTLQAIEPVCNQLHIVPDDAFFHLLQRNSEQAATQNNYSRPILYRW